MKIKANGIEMNYNLAGQGKTIVLVHGFSDNLNMWFNQAPVLSKHYQVLTYDVRGFGKTQISDVAYSMDLFADDLYALLHALNMDIVI